MEKNKIIIDWLSVSSKIHTPEAFISDLGLDGVVFEQGHGFYGYAMKLYFDGINIHYSGHNEEMGVLLEMSGQGCRNFETYGNGNYESIFADVHENPGDMNITRLDIASDDLEGLLNLNKIAKKARAGEYVSPLREWAINTSSTGLTVSFGSKKSDVYIRIYDKARERGFDDGRHWVRCELQLRRERAYGFAMLLLQGKPVGEAYSGVLLNYLRFIENDATQKGRCTTSPFLEKIFADCRED